MADTFTERLAEMMKNQPPVILTTPDESDVTSVVGVGFKKLYEDAVIPTKAYVTDSGFDLYAVEDVVIEPGETKVVQTGVAFQLPPGMEAQVRPKSGITAKTKLRVQLGTLDNGFTGDIGVMVDNTSVRVPGKYTPRYQLVNGKSEYSGGNYEEKGTYLIRKGDKIAQLVVQYIPQVEGVEITELNESERGENGYGSSGTRSKEDE